MRVARARRSAASPSSLTIRSRIGVYACGARPAARRRAGARISGSCSGGRRVGLCGIGSIGSCAGTRGVGISRVESGLMGGALSGGRGIVGPGSVMCGAQSNRRSGLNLTRSAPLHRPSHSGCHSSSQAWRSSLLAAWCRRCLKTTRLIDECPAPHRYGAARGMSSTAREGAPASAYKRDPCRRTRSIARGSSLLAINLLDQLQ